MGEIWAQMQWFYTMAGLIEIDVWSVLFPLFDVV
jgi:hypothetical protein